MLRNGLIEREFTTSPDFACVSFRSLMHRPPAEILRAVQPEALVQLDGVTYHVGGLVVPPSAVGNCSADACPSAAHLGIWTDKGTLSGMVRNDSAFTYVSHSTGTPQPQFEWIPGTRHAPTDVAWPAKGVTLSVTFSAPATAAVAHRQLEVTIHYELFSGAPVVTKSLTIGPKPGVSPADVAHIVVTGATVEYLSVTQPYSPLALYSYAPPARDEPYAHGNHGQGEAYNGMLWVEQDSSHGQIVTWQDDPIVVPRGGAAPGMGEPVLNVSYSDQKDRFAPNPPAPPPLPVPPPPPCPTNCTAFCHTNSVPCANCTACGYCANPGGRIVHGPDQGEIYPYYGNPCHQQSDCRQCALDRTCTCTAIVSPAGQERSCCKANGGHDHGGQEYSFGVPLDPRLPGTEGGVFQSFRTIELVLDSTEKERSSLAVRRMKRLLAPASQENPIFMHLTAAPTDSKGVEAAIDQMQVCC